MLTQEELKRQLTAGGLQCAKLPKHQGVLDQLPGGSSRQHPTALTVEEYIPRKMSAEGYPKHMLSYTTRKKVPEPCGTLAIGAFRPLFACRERLRRCASPSPGRAGPR